MSGYGLTSAGIYAKQKASAINRPIRRIRKEKKMKLTFRQRIRNWLMRDNNESDISQIVAEEVQFQSDGMRLQVYRASGGYVVETRSYDRKNDRNHNTMHIITDDEDLGERIGKIIMMEALRG